MRRGAHPTRRAEFRLLGWGVLILIAAAALLGLYFAVGQPRALVPVLFAAWAVGTGAIAVGLTVWVERR